MSFMMPKAPKPPPPPPSAPTMADASRDVTSQTTAPIGNYVGTGSAGGLTRKAKTVKASLLG